MRPVVIQIERTKERTAETCAFAHSPVRIGRNPLNDIELDDGYVSQWHGVLRFDEDRVSYLDLGSTNPTLVDGEAVDRNKDVPITDTTDLRIGQFRLHVLRVDEAPAELFGARRKTAFARTGMNDASSVAATMYLPEPTRVHSKDELSSMLNLHAGGGDHSAWLGSPPPAKSAPPPPPPVSSRPPPPPLPGRSPLAAPPGGPGPQPLAASMPRPSLSPGASGRPRTMQSMPPHSAGAVSVGSVAVAGAVNARPSVSVLGSGGNANAAWQQPRASHPAPAEPASTPAGTSEEALRQAYANYRQSWRVVSTQLHQRLQQTPPERRGQLLDALVHEFPDIGHEADFRALLPELGLSPLRTGVPEMEDWLRRLTDNMFPPPNVAINVALAMERIGEVLEVFSTAFVELREAHARFCDEMSLERPPSDSILQTTKNPRLALAYLLNPSREGSSKVEELARSMADFALHQVALVSAVVEGARGILQDIAPETVAKPDPKAPKPGLLSRLFSNEVQVQWDRYRGLFAEMVEEDRFTRLLFGRAFARKYYAIMGGRRSLTPSRS